MRTAVAVLLLALPLATRAATFEICGGSPPACELTSQPPTHYCRPFTSFVPATKEWTCTAPISPPYATATGSIRSHAELFRQSAKGSFAFTRADRENWWWGFDPGLTWIGLITADTVTIGGTSGSGILRLTFVLAGSAGGTEVSATVGASALAAVMHLNVRSPMGLFYSRSTPGTLIADIPFDSATAPSFEWGIDTELRRNAGWYDVGQGASGHLDETATLVSAQVLGAPDATIVSSTGEPYPGSGTLTPVGAAVCACGKMATVPSQWTIAGGGAMFAATNAEFDRWNFYANVFGARTTGGSPMKENATNEIGFVSIADAHARYGFDLDPTYLGVTWHSPEPAFGYFDECPTPEDAACDEFAESDVLIISDAARGWTFDGPPPLEGSGPNYYAATALHELGHSLGLHHNFYTLSTMNYLHDFAARYLTLGDASAVRANYGAQTNAISDIAAYPFRHDGDCKRSGIVVASASPQSVVPGATLTLRDFRVENVGTGAVANTALDVYLSDDATIESSDHWLGRLVWPSFAEGSYWDNSSGWDFTVPADTPSGTYYVGAIATVSSAEDAVTYNNRWILDASRRVTVTGGRAAAVFTDDPLVTGTTAVKALHVTELQTLVSAQRAALSLPAFPFASSVAAGSIIRAAHVLELRAALDELRSAAGLPPIAYAHALASGSVIRAADIAEIRNALR